MSIFHKKNAQHLPSTVSKKNIGWKQSKHRMFSDPKMQISSLRAELVEQGCLYYQTKPRIYEGKSPKITIKQSPQHG